MNTRRLAALDILRGFAVILMIIANNPGSSSYVLPPFAHAEWNGLTLADVVFPCFVFSIGVSLAFSLRRCNYQFSTTVVVRVLRRALVLLAISYGVGWFSRFLTRFFSQEFEGSSGERWMYALLNFDEMRLMGVFVRLALCSFFVSLLAMTLSRRAIRWLVAALLCGYSVLLLIGNGYALSMDNIVGVIDRAIIPEAMLYKGMFIDGQAVPFDPEGLISTVPAIAHCLIGFLCGRLLIDRKEHQERFTALALRGILLLLGGWLLTFLLPCNKKVWSPSFVLITSGGCMLVLCLLLEAEVRNKLKGLAILQDFGSNALLLYVSSTVLTLLLARIPLYYVDGARVTLFSLFYRRVLLVLFRDPYIVSIGYPTCIVLALWSLAHILRKKKIYIRL